MDATFVAKRPPDPAAVAAEPATKRRHPQPPPPSLPSVASAATITPTLCAFSKVPQLRPSPSEALFRLLCPANKTGALIGKGGSIIRQLRELTSARIHIDDSFNPSCDERVVFIVADRVREVAVATSAVNAGESNTTGSVAQLDSSDRGVSNNDGESNNLGENGEDGPSSFASASASAAQHALVKVFERMVKVDEERAEEGNSSSNGGGDENASVKGLVVCRLLAPSNQVGSVLGKGGKIVEKIRQESGAQVRVLPKDHLPASASPGDELIQITGNFVAVKKALLSVSGCLQDNPRTDTAGSGAYRTSDLGLQGNGMPDQVDSFPHRSYASALPSSDYNTRGYPSMSGPESIGVHHTVLEEEVLFKLLCHVDKVGSLIGKGGSIIRALQSETGASIKIADAAPNSDERVVIISARESLEKKHSPAQDAVIRVHSRIAEIGFERGAAVVARLLVHPQQIGFLLGKGGFIITEIRRATGASICVFPNEQAPKCGIQNDEVVQIIGSMQSVQDALLQITTRLRETIFPMKPPFPNITGPPCYPSFPERPPPQFRSRQPASSVLYASAGYSYSVDRTAFPSQPLDHRPAFSHVMDLFGSSNLDRIPCGIERPRPLDHHPAYDRQSSPRSCAPPAVSSVNSKGTTDSGSLLAPRIDSSRSENQANALTIATVEVIIPQNLLSHVYGKNNSNLSHIKEISGADVIVHDTKPGASEGVVVVSGTSDQRSAAQSLIQAFIFCGQTS